MKKDLFSIICILGMGCADSTNADGPKVIDTDDQAIDTDTTQDTDGTSEDDADTDDTDVDTDTDGDTGTETEAEFSFKPTPGTWVVSQFDTISDGCGLSGFSDDGDVGSTLDLTLTGGNNFQMVFEDGGHDFQCTIASEDGDFDCEPAESTNAQAQDMGVDCLILIDLQGNGSFASSEEVTIKTDVAMEGDGDSCSLLEMVGISMPCEMSTESVVELQL